MYNQTITLCNFLELEDTYNLITINNTEVQPIYNVNNEIDGTNDTSKVLVIIMYEKDNNGRYIMSNGNKVYYKTPKKWGGQREYFTLQGGKDFILIGEYHNDSTYININDLKNETDEIFMINRISDFQYDLMHFELTCN